MNKLSVEQLKNLVIAVLLMVIGILFCCSLAMGIEGLSIIIGIILLVIGILFLINSIVGSKDVLTTGGLTGVVISTLGVMFMVNKLAGIIFVFIPWFLIILGSVVILDAFLGKFFRGENSTLEFVIKLIVGIISFVLGVCLRIIDGFAEYASIMLGILMIIYSTYMIFMVFTKGNTQQNIIN